jgi:hypothetical protein
MLSWITGPFLKIFGIIAAVLAAVAYIFAKGARSGADHVAVADAKITTAAVETHARVTADVAAAPVGDAAKQLGENWQAPS